MMILCSRCRENRAATFDLCNECSWFVLTGTTTFTPADMEAAAAYDLMVDMAIEDMIMEMHGY